MRPSDFFTTATAATGSEPQGLDSRSAARAFAAAISALLISTLVINRSSEALSTDGTAAASTVSSGVIELVDDDGGRSLFDLSNLGPGTEQARCIEVTYAGTITPVILTMTTEATGELAPWLDVTVDEGTGGSFDDCDDFRRSDEVFVGDLAELSEVGMLALGPISNTGESRTYRIAVSVQDVPEALGKSATLDVLWEVTPS